MSTPNSNTKTESGPEVFNRDYHIRRENMLHAINMPKKLPIGKCGEWTNVEVTTGRWCDDWQTERPAELPRKTIILPRVRLMACGVANRLRVVCPVCRVTEVRFSVLQQHAKSKKCIAAAVKRLKEESEHINVPEGSAVFSCPRCLSNSLSAGDGCNNCGYGYEDEDDTDTLTEAEIEQAHAEMAADNDKELHRTNHVPEENVVREEFEHNGKKYAARSRLVDTDYGPENRVNIFEVQISGREEKVSTFQESMSTKQIIQMFKDNNEEQPEPEYWHKITPNGFRISTAWASQEQIMLDQGYMEGLPTDPKDHEQWTTRPINATHPIPSASFAENIEAYKTWSIDGLKLGAYPEDLTCDLCRV